MQKNTHFGMQSVSSHEKKKLVMGVFSSVAEKYDLMNDAMSLGVHRLWKKTMLSKCQARHGDTVLDVAAGSADISLGLFKKVGASGQVVFSDLNAAMLHEGAQRVLDHGILFQQMCAVQADGSRLPFADNSFNVVSISFGIRNFVDIERGLSEFYRVLKPGGQFICLEFSHPDLPMLDVVYDAYSYQVIPWLGEQLVNDRDSYQYLVESIRRFPNQKRFSKLIQWAGFDMVRYQNMSGGIVALHRGYKI
ncbi:MAG: bifunctional demethylmenaquinone methyltransferase/2-methoxy-6-polyprenyl-1,4-benzoquinol methylase UbiE [Mariprofundaceae bacterium]|nr:bifunctional demethylmenaquinone methyltransferase/2-methoxy-6-polyprenyl-1,4-benzoquinol methylase UbiE [Mariprofundaceae bacterium]